ncbi:MAG: NAD-dependent succinate-semialdehyde dehydrogenase [Candidatus Omnitrophica bacterium]|nr:NAD-dependent succinate-semialdehyde dehydrogenase [Candidatus Omnitrophota bacterium]MDE2009868.1 NAD-dependent succinate-semialdehyde dehydrogenase [Candidatus Omnitrophota bacterium]MDE2214350.1 NAD-dependent succinate-semialdehyde dehydrogenase [Candidatus Omnitrophota bacterium]MDE2231099.1 NAD-dependent succinate-semialdehyde dehydrogenase [Candidatus Omnitrophota bacterium]
MNMQTIDPTTGRKIKSYADLPFSKIDGILERAMKSSSLWRGLSFQERIPMMRKAAVLLRTDKDDFARLMALEMGKPFSQGQGEIEKCALVCEFYAQHAETFLAKEHIKTEATKSFVTYDPLGIILAIMPWNFPFWQVFRCAAPALMAGNAVILKHASNVCGCALAIENIFHRAGFPPSLFSNVFIPGKEVKGLIEHPLISAVSLTGSTQAGKSVACVAGSVLKKIVLELGGSDPYIILKDADLDKAVEICINSRLINCGQSCISAKRFIIEGPVFKEFEAKFTVKMQSQRMGPPLDEGINLGPMARHDLRDQLHSQVMRSVEQGARRLCGGRIPDELGAFYPPTVLTNVRPGMAAYQEELFGPVASLIKAVDETDAVRIANDTVFGLGSAVFTRDINKAEYIAQQLQAGSCFVNEAVRSDPRLPFGGIKESGYGRELAKAGIQEFVNVKTIYIK